MSSDEARTTTSSLDFAAFRRQLRSRGIYVALLALVVIAGGTVPNFLEPNNLLNIMRGVAIVGVIAVGQTFVAIGGGMADLSVGSMVGLAAVIALGLHDPIGPVGAAAVALGAGVLVGLLNGVFVGRFRTNAIVTTIGTGVVINGLALWFTAGDTMFGTSPEFHELGTGAVAFLPNPVVMFLVIVGVAHVLLSRTIFGRRLYATGGNYEATRASAIRVRRIVGGAFGLSAFAAAIAGVMLAALLNQANYDSGTTYTFNSIAAVAVGGTSLFGGEGSVMRTVAGVLIIGLLNNVVVLIGLPLNAQIVVTGSAIFVAVALDVVIRGRSR